MDWPETAQASLGNEYVLLRPLAPEDYPALLAIALDADVWRHFVVNITSENDFATYFESSLAAQAAGERVVFTITDQASGQVAGSMSYSNMVPAERRLEIGSSWLGAPFRGTGTNRWAKYLLLRNAFEGMEAERVEFKTDVLNERARRGLRNIGAVEEGVLRSYNFMPGGRRRDAIYYSVLRAEWPDVKQRIQRGAAS